MQYKIYGPYEIPKELGEFKRRIDKEDISKFWDDVDPFLENACGIYIFSIKTEKREKPWYIGKAKNQTFSQECFTSHKIVHYHDALEKSKGTPVMYFLARHSDAGRASKPSKSKTGYPEMDFVETMFIEKGYYANKHLRNKRGTKNPEQLVVEGFYNHKDYRKKTTKQLYELFN